MREARKASGLTQAQMSDIFGIPLRTIEDWEAGRREPRRYVRILVLFALRNYALFSKFRDTFH